MTLQCAECASRTCGCKSIIHASHGICTGIRTNCGVCQQWAAVPVHQEFTLPFLSACSKHIYFKMGALNVFFIVCGFLSSHHLLRNKRLSLNWVAACRHRVLLMWVWHVPFNILYFTENTFEQMCLGKYIWFYIISPWAAINSQPNRRFHSCLIDGGKMDRIMTRVHLLLQNLFTRLADRRAAFRLFMT